MIEPLQDGAVPSNPDVEATPLPESLSEAEREELRELEDYIRKAEWSFVLKGDALASIRDRKLFRDCFSFETYCRERWGYFSQSAREMIGTAEMAKYLSTIADTVAPTNESQVRPLMGMPLGKAGKIWKRANSSGTPVFGREVRRAIQAHYDEKSTLPQAIEAPLGCLLRSFDDLANRLDYTDFSGMNMRERSSVASALQEVIELATKAGCWPTPTGDALELEDRDETLPNLE